MTFVLLDTTVLIDVLEDRSPPSGSSTCNLGLRPRVCAITVEEVSAWLRPERERASRCSRVCRWHHSGSTKDGLPDGGDADIAAPVAR
jgi:hypothetical protein